MDMFRKKTSTRANVSRTPDANKSVYSYYQKRSNIDATSRKKPAERPQKRSQPRFLQHIPTLLFVITVFCSLFYLSTTDPRVKLVVLNGQLKDSNASIRSESIYQEAAEQFIKRSVVNRSKLTLDTSGLEESLLMQFPELAAVSATVPIMGRRPVVRIQATQPALILKSAEKSVLIGNNGIALLETKDVKNISSLNLRVINDQSGISVELGKAALPQEQASFISIMIEQLEKQDIGIQSATIPASPYDLHVKIQGKPYFVKFNIRDDPKQQSGAYIALKKDLEARGITVKEYVDVRAGERIFYK